MKIFARELAALTPDAILAHTTPVTGALQRETRTIPIVFVVVGDPVGEGFVAGLSHPGGNITGFSYAEGAFAGKACRLLVPVKTRINTTCKGKLKTDCYNLYTKPGHHEAATKIAAFAGAKIFWVAVTVDAKARTFSAYMGDVDKLPSPTGIPMHPTRDVPNHKCLTKNQPDNEILESWSNVVETVSG
jgi:ABC transporter substrate binding protein